MLRAVRVLTLSGRDDVTLRSMERAVATALPTVSSITHFSIGVASAGATNILYSGTVTPNINVSTGVQPILTTASTITED